jgi:hypothetical protein
LLSISLSKIDIYSNGLLIGPDKCNLKAYNQSRPIFLDNFRDILFESVIYPKEWCPLIFQNSKIRQLVFRDIANSLINSNSLQFSNQTEVSIKLKANLKLFIYYDT